MLHNSEFEFGEKIYTKYSIDTVLAQYYCDTVVPSVMIFLYLIL